MCVVVWQNQRELCEQRLGYVRMLLVNNSDHQREIDDRRTALDSVVTPLAADSGTFPEKQRHALLHNYAAELQDLLKQIIPGLYQPHPSPTHSLQSHFLSRVS